MDTPIASDVKVFVPAMNFRQSLEFYKAMGWNINWRADDSLAELELADCRFYLQNYYNEVRLRANCDALADTSTEAFGFSLWLRFRSGLMLWSAAPKCSKS